MQSSSSSLGRREVDRPRSRHYSDLLEEMVERHPDREAVVGCGQRLSYRQLLTEARTVAKGLYALGVRPGDRVALLMSNRPEWPVAAFGAFQIGATVVPLSTWYRSWDIDHTLKHCEAQLLITMGHFRNHNYLDTLLELAPELANQDRNNLALERFPDLRRVVVFGSGRAIAGTFAFNEMVAIGGSIPDEAIAECRRAVSANDLGFILYTSGSSAAPKGVMLQHFACCENSFDIGERLHLGADDRLWLVVSLAYSFGSINGLSAIMTHGGCAVLQEYMDAGEALGLLAKERVTVVYLWPNITNSLLAHPSFGKCDLSSLRTGITPGTPTEVRRTIEDLRVTEICMAYGSTETYGNCTIHDAGDPIDIRTTSHGMPLPGMAVQVVDRETGRTVRTGVTGEILVSGYIAVGYWNDNENTLATFKDGVYHSGDLGYLDEAGRLHFLGRINSMIKTGGMNVAPPEVEAFLTTHPRVKAAYVLGLPDHEKGEVVVAFVEIKRDMQLGEDELREFCHSHIAAYKIPHQFVFVEPDQVPRTSTGKANYRELPKLIS